MTTRNFDKIIGKNIKQIRKLKHRKLYEISDALGVSLQQVHKYELGANKINARSLYILSKYYNIPISAFFENIGDDY